MAAGGLGGSTPPQLLGLALRWEEEARWVLPLLAATHPLDLRPLLCARGEVPVEEERGGTQREARRMAVNNLAVALVPVAVGQAHGPGSQARHAAQRAAGGGGARLVLGGAEARGRTPRTARPARQSLAPHRLALRSAVGSSSELVPDHSLEPVVTVSHHSRAGHH